jgi:pimeloyl-ACP methyl ester carboxylesterase
MLLLGVVACQHQEQFEAAPGTGCVALLHGLARSDASMNPLAEALQRKGYFIVNEPYDSRAHGIEELAAQTVPAAIARCEAEDARPLHFVTHSLGGILVRQYLATHPHPRDLGRVMMLSPPNQGSEVVDAMKNVPGFGLFGGPAGRALGTDPESLPRRLPPVDFELGVIAGTASINPLFSALLPGKDDGAVSVTSARVEGMQDFVLVPRSHTYIMKSDDAIDQALWFLETGHFRTPAVP